MQFHISDRIASLKPSAIREIFKYATDPSVITLAGGNPAPESLPLDTMKTLLGQIFDDDPMLPLLYSQSEGHPPLREACKTWLAKKGLFTENDDLMIVSGAQQCMDLTTKVLCNEGDTILCENPSFIGSLNTFRSYNVNLVGVDMEDDGISIEKLEHALKTERNVRMMYLIPNFQNPTGITMSLEKRRAVYALAKQYGVPILEDNPYGDLRFAGESLPTLKSMDTDGLVIYAGTFSKILATGIRVGYLIAPKTLFDRLVVAKQCTDVHSSMPAQLLCYRFLTQCDIDAHVASLPAVYERKCGLMLQELDKINPEVIRYNRPQGGLFVWAQLLNTDDSSDICLQLVRDHKVCVVPGNAFLVRDGEASTAMRLNFSTPTDENLVEGTRRIAGLLNSLQEATR